ncbi:MAG: ComF family protein [candidate division WOR-3 bacterium]|nr:MAG: ComF family protein [candidate division WOR-3 bacterium]
MIQALKYNGKTGLARLLGDALTRLVESDPVLAGSDHVCPVPLHPARIRERGYNQAFLLASEVAKGTGIGFCDMLVRVRNTRTQTGILGNDERKRNLRRAFKLRTGIQVSGSRVLLVDDVVTSGATLDSAARQLLGAGARAVVGIAVAAA